MHYGAISDVTLRNDEQFLQKFKKKKRPKYNLDLYGSLMPSMQHILKTMQKILSVYM